MMSTKPQSINLTTHLDPLFQIDGNMADQTNLVAQNHWGDQSDRIGQGDWGDKSNQVDQTEQGDQTFG